MTLEATVLIPTHDHGAMLLHSARSALAQTIRDLEVFIIGDGAPEETRDAARTLGREDGRVRFFDHPKGPRHGEIHRHAALKEARGKIVAYLSDDDLWLPEHLEVLREALKEADFANVLPARIDRDGTVAGWGPLDLERPRYRALLLGGENRVPLSCAGHTMEMYRRLPEGWRTTPAGIPTDLYMWQQFLSHPHCRARSTFQATALVFRSPPRKGRSSAQRIEEMASWQRRLSDPNGRSGFQAEVLAFQTRRGADLEEECARRIEEIRLSPAWRWGDRLVRLPLVGRLLGPAARDPAGPGVPPAREARHRGGRP